MQLNLENIQPTRKTNKPRFVIYGPNGVGKSEFANQFPSPLFIDIEKNLGHLKTITQQQVLKDGKDIENVVDLLEFIKALINSPILPYKTVILDSIHKLEEKIIVPQACLELGMKFIAEKKWGEGYSKVAQMWSQIFDALENLSISKNLTVILIGHDCLDERIDVSKNISYPYQRPLIAKKSYQSLLNWSTCVLYFNFNFNESGRPASNSIGIPKEKSGNLIYASPDAGFIAKNQYGITQPLPLNFDVFFEKVNKFYTQETKEK